MRIEMFGRRRGAGVVIQMLFCMEIILWVVRLLRGKIDFLCREVEDRNKVILLWCAGQPRSHHCWDLGTGSGGGLQGIRGIVWSFLPTPQSLISTALFSLTERPYCVWLLYPRRFFCEGSLLIKAFAFSQCQTLTNLRNNTMVFIRWESVLRKRFDFQLLYFHITG